MPRMHEGSKGETSLARPAAKRHRLETVGRACRVLRAFADDREMLTLAEICARTGLEKTIAFRLVHTLEDEGFLRKSEGRRYCSNVRVLNKKRFRIGFAAQTSDSFSGAVSESLRWSAEANQVDLVLVDNHYSAKTAVRNAQRLIDERVDLAVEFQTYERVAPIISSLFQTAGIPLIAVEIPHPGATFFGVDNYRVGLVAGRALVKAARQAWQGQVEELLLLELEIAGSLPHLRLAGAEAAIREALPGVTRVRHIDTRGEFLRSFDAVRKYLQANPARRTLITGINDPAVLGALRAFEEVGRTDFRAVALGATAEARQELRSPGTRLVGSIAFFPEHYGEGLTRLALDILHKRNVPPAAYVQHQMITPDNVNHFYPNDAGAERRTSGSAR